jgi:ketosteroid isomerase-like protein
MKRFPCILLFALPLYGFAQNQQLAINEQVWKPFCEALTALDTSRYLSVHSQRLVRVERANKKIYGYEVYRQNTLRGFETALQNRQAAPDVHFGVELRFLERIASDELAFEVGYYKSTLQFPDGRKQIYYSQFYVTLIRESGQWRIATDASLPLPQLTEQEFLKASAM